MSRIIVKNLPNGLKEDRLKSLFDTEGQITDCSLKYTKDGKFRKFAFIGFTSEKEANSAVNHFNKSFIDTSRIQVEIAKDLGDVTKPRAWSKYSSDSSAFKLTAEKDTKSIAPEESKKKKKKVKDGVEGELLGELKDDQDFHEFLSAHQSKSNKPTWSNDTVGIGKSDSNVGVNVEEDQGKRSESSVEENVEMEEDTGDEDSESEKEENVPVRDKPANKGALSDIDYIKSKKSKSTSLWSDSDASSDSENDESDNEKKKISKSNQESGKTNPNDSESSSESEEDAEKAVKQKSPCADKSAKQKSSESKRKASRKSFRHCIKMRGLPPSIKEGQIREFFKPVVPTLVKIPRNAKGKQTFSIATIEFKDEKQQDAAMRKNKNYIGPKRIYLHKLKEEIIEDGSISGPARPWEKSVDEEVETIGESGRLYVRNLAYICKEDDLETLLSRFGPLTEVHLPIDSFTKKIKGFAFITFMIPEHAVKAHTELDGTTFQGRILHILPGKPKKDEEDSGIEGEGSSYKKKMAAKKKAQAGSSHNWNALFLGANAVADVMAEKYDTSKSDLLNPTGKQSLGVRLALGETQLVSETRDFLTDNGVMLDAFSQAAAARSKTVILVKNLPAGTKAIDLKELFARFGSIGRVLLPPSGVTAIIEYLEPTEARKGFQSLAYTKHLPLYLEWAPVNVFKDPAKPSTSQGKTAQAGASDSDGDESDSDDKEQEIKGQESEESSSSEEETDEPGRTLFVKSLNFETSEKSLQDLFATAGALKGVSIAKKKDMKNPGKMLSMGYGFIEFKNLASCQKALKDLQHATLDGHQLELKVSNRATVSAKPDTKKKQDPKKKQKSTKILVRNIPFEAKQKEVQELFSVFGELKSARMPKKVSGTGSHRGFAFIDFLAKQDAKRAFNALCHSTHLYGRRLVLEWADTEDTVDQLRGKTAQHFSSGGASKKLKKSGLMEELKLGTLQ